MAASSGEGPDFYNQQGQNVGMPNPGKWLLAEIPLAHVETGLNQVGISAAAGADLTLNDLRIWVGYGSG